MKRKNEKGKKKQKTVPLFRAFLPFHKQKADGSSCMYVDAKKSKSETNTAEFILCCISTVLQL